MKRYGICFLLLVVTSFACLAAGFFLTRANIRKEQPVPNTVYETETYQEEKAAVNQEKIISASEKQKEQEKYYLVSEEGFLMVFCQDKKTICLYTHMPLMDFPEKEQVKLRKGIWFSSMMDIFDYLESYTS